MTHSLSASRPILMRWLKQLLLLGGFLTLLLDIRFEHREVVGEAWQAWIPIAYAAAMIFIVPLGTAVWKQGGNKVLIVFYAFSLVVGVLGVTFHAHGHLFERVGEVLSVWQNLINKIDPKASFHPPLLAPLAFVGMGAFGILFTWADNEQH